MNRTGDEGPDMEFSLDQANGIPVYRQIIRQIEHAVLSGRLKTGDKLPTIRSLAVALKINPNTIAKAYGELEIRGILTTQVGSGTYISDKKPDDDEAALNGKIREALGRFLQEMRGLGVEKTEALRLIEGFNEGKDEDCSKTSVLEQQA
jgi:GntR family transcriptional regulator